MLEPDDYNITPASNMEHPVHKQMVGKNISVNSDKITGEVYNPNDYKIDSAMVTVVLEMQMEILCQAKLNLLTRYHRTEVSLLAFLLLQMQKQLIRLRYMPIYGNSYFMKKYWRYNNVFI